MLSSLLHAMAAAAAASHRIRLNLNMLKTPSRLQCWGSALPLLCSAVNRALTAHKGIQLHHPHRRFVCSSKNQAYRKNSRSISNNLNRTARLNEKKRSERRKHCARAGCSKVRTPPARPLQTHKPRQDRLQYTAPQLASAQCKYNRIS